jgi:hypothetical protein
MAIGKSVEPVGEQQRLLRNLFGKIRSLRYLREDTSPGRASFTDIAFISAFWSRENR